MCEMKRLLSPVIVFLMVETLFSIFLKLTLKRITVCFIAVGLLYSM